MTGRERILAAFNGSPADFVPLAPTIYLWYYYHRYHGGDMRRFIFASSCMTSPLTPWKNLVYLRDAGRECGRLA